MASNKIQMNISLCIPTYNRTGLLFDAFREVVTDDRVSEIVIVDDHSDDEIFTTIAWYCKDIPKVKLYRNEKNLDCYRNKREAISKATNEWVIIFDSDNVISKAYIDRIENLYVAGLNQSILYQPSFAEPNFNFTTFEGLLVTKTNVHGYMHDSTFQTMLNAMNYLVSREEYLKVWDGNIDPVTSDSIFQNFNWLNSGNGIYVVPELKYHHRVHSGSHYQNNVRRTPRGFHEEIVNKLKQLA